MKLKPEKVQGIVIPLYRLGDGRTAFSDNFGGPRRVRKFTSEAKARAEARLLAMRILRGEALRSEFRAQDLAIYRRALEIVAPMGQDIVIALTEWAEAKRMIGSADLLSAGKRRAEVAACFTAV